MGLMDKLRRAEEQGKAAAHRGLDRARETWEDAEGRLRRKMRLHPRTINENAPEPMPEQTLRPAATSGPMAVESLPHHASEEDAA